MSARSMRSVPLLLLTIFALLVVSISAQAQTSTSANVGINVLLKAKPTSAVLSDLSRYGNIRSVMRSINAVTLRGPAANIRIIRGKSYVKAVGQDAIRTAIPIDTVEAEDFANGINTWNLDAINVTDLGKGRVIGYTGQGVIVAVLDTGLLPTWRQYFPEQRILSNYGIAFQGGGAVDNGAITTPPLKWERDVNSHGTHVTSTIIGYSFNGTPVNGVAPLVRVIPVKVLNQNGSGWSSMIAAGIVYVTNLVRPGGPLAGRRLVVNMSLSGSRLDPVERAAVDYAIANGVVLVGSAGNRGAAGMGYPGAYSPVISVAASGWIGEWRLGSDTSRTNWWFADDVPNPTKPQDFYIADFSSRELAGQDLDVAAPGSWVVGPYQTNQSNRTSYLFLGGTSMAAPHVTGTAALMLQKNSGLSPTMIESILESSAVPISAGCRTVLDPFQNFAGVQICWGANATGSGLVIANGALANTP